MNRTERRFERIYSDYYQKVFSFLYKLCHDTPAADKMLKDTFYQAFRRMTRFDGRCEMLTWLLSVSIECFMDYLNDTENEEITVDMFVTDPGASLSDAPGYRLSKELEVSEVRRVLSDMSENERLILIMKLYGEISFEELGNLAGIAPESAKLIYTRAGAYAKEELFNE